MEVQPHFPGQKSRKHLLALSCVTALAGVALIARPAFAEEAAGEVSFPNEREISAGTENIQTTTDLVETSPANADDTAQAEISPESSPVENTEMTSQPSLANPAVVENTTDIPTANETSLINTETITTKAEPVANPQDTVTGGHYYSDNAGNWYYRDANGRNVTGEHIIDGQEVYFNYDGKQVKGDFSGDYYKLPETVSYYDANSGAKVSSEGFVQNKAGQTFYLDDKGIRVTGIRDIDGNLYYFRIREVANPRDTGVLQKGLSISLEDGASGPKAYGFGTPGPITRRYYFDETSGQAVKNRLIKEQDGWYYYGADGNSIRPEAGEVTIDGKIIYLNQNGRQIKGELVLQDGILRYYDAETGERLSNTSLTINGMTYQFDQDGIATDAPNPNGYYSDDQGNWYYKNSQGENLKGSQIINGQRVYFRDNGQQVKGPLVRSQYSGLSAFYDVDTGELWTNRFVHYQNKWYYVGEDGKPLVGAHRINGQNLFFSTYGDPYQIKGDFAQDGVYMPEYFYDKDSGDKVTSSFVTDKNGRTFFVAESGEKLTGLHTIKDKRYFFQPANGQNRYNVSGRLNKGVSYSFDDKGTDGLSNNSAYQIDTHNRRSYYFSAETGEALTNQWVKQAENWFYYGADGNGFRPTAGEVTIDGSTVYLFTTGRRAQNDIVLDNGNIRFYDADGKRATNTTITLNGMTYQFDEEGNGVNTTLDGGYYYSDTSGNWYYKGNNDQNITGSQIINGQTVYFQKDGKQVKGDLVFDNGINRYYDEHTGSLVTNQTRLINGKTYHMDAKGRAILID